MTVTLKSTIYIGLVFAIGWPVLIGGWLSGHRDPGETGLFLLAFAASPGLAAIVCTLAFERGRRLEALGLNFRPNLWWLWPLPIALLITLGSIAITTLLSPHRVPGMDSIVHEGAKILGFRVEKGLTGLAGMLGLILLRNAILFSLTEELGWRGYLYGLWRPSGFWRSSLATGLVWGVWHWPVIYLHGLNYPNAPIIGSAVFPIFTMLTACLMTLVRDRGGSVWAAGILHGAINTFPMLFLFSLGDLGWPWGVAGVGGILTTAIAVAAMWWLQRRDAKRNDVSLSV